MKRKIHTLEVYIGYFHSYLDYLSNNKRAFIDEVVHANHYYLIYNHSLVVGGFATNTNGTVAGFFTLLKGYEDIFLDTVLAQAEIDSAAPWIDLLCCGTELRDYYLKHGWTTDAIYAWDESKRNKLWDTEILGRPDFFRMSIKSTL